MHRQELISHAEALKNATNREALTMALRGISSSKAVSEPGQAAAAPRAPRPPVRPPATAPKSNGNHPGEPHAARGDEEYTMPD